LSLRYPLIEARLQRTVWAATPDLIQTVARAVRRAQDGPIHLSADGQRPQVEAAVQRFGVASEGGRVVRLDPTAQQSAVAVIPVFGVLGKYLSGMEAECGDGFDLRGLERNLREVAADPSISDVVLHFHSPGGSVTGIPEAAQLIGQIAATKPVYAYTDSEMCSAAYWLAAATTAVFASPMASVASIGCYLAWIDESVAMEAQGLKLILIKDGEYKGATLPGQLTDEAAALLLAEVKAYGGGFRADVSQWRKAASGIDVPDSAMQGQVILARDAIEVGLVDGVYRSLDDLLLDLTTTQKDTNP
jgi:ClpP class serine protease